MHLKFLTTSRLKHNDGENSFLLNSPPEIKDSTLASQMATTEPSPAVSGGHVPLSSSLSQIVARELGGGGGTEESAPGGTSTTTNGASSSPKPEAPSSSTAAEVQGRLQEEEDASAALVHQRQLAVAQQLVAQRRAEAILRQRQLEQLEQLRQVQALSLLYPTTVTPGLGSSSLLVEALLAQRQQHQQQQLLAAAQLANAARAARPPSGSAGAGTVPSANDEAEESSDRDKVASARSAPKRAIDKLPEDLESNKKPKREASSDDNDDDDSSKGHRFRPYQYEQWTEKFQELTDFKKVKGHCQVPHTYTENPPLARWVKRQRYQYKLKIENKQSTMTDERVRLLEEIGFIWDSHAAAWAEKLHELKEYAELRGDCNVPSTYPSNPQLATWVKCQRRQYKLLRDAKTSNMTIERIRQLEAIGFIWEVRKSWDSSRS